MAPLILGTAQFGLDYGVANSGQVSPLQVAEILSAAEQLGIKAQGHAAVRVRRFEPSEKDRERLRKGKPAASLERVSERELQRLRARMAPAVR